MILQPARTPFRRTIPAAVAAALIALLPAGGEAQTEAPLAGGGDANQRLAALEAEVEKLRDSEAKRQAAAAQKPSLQISGLLQIDYLYFGQDAASREAVGDIEDGVAVRRARLVGQGQAFDVVDYAIGFDFALAGRPTFLDVFVGVHDLPYLGRVRAGHYFEPFSLERMTVVRYTTFLERSLADTFAPARNVGFSAQNTVGEEPRGTWAVGWFRTATDDFGEDVGDDGEQAVTARTTWLPYWDEASEGRSYVHLGAGYSYRDADEDAVIFRTTPEARLGALGEGAVPFFVNTGNIAAEHLQLFGLELAAIRGPLSFQAEFMHVPVQQRGGPEVQFRGAYAYVSYFLTGEHRPYNRDTGTFDRVVPFENFFRVRTDQGIEQGRGAWELAARWSYIDLDDADISGGTLHDFTLGLNWYLNPYTRLKWEYIRADLDQRSFGHSTTHIVGMRFDFDF